MLRIYLKTSVWPFVSSQDMLSGFISPAFHLFLCLVLWETLAAVVVFVLDVGETASPLSDDVVHL